jgi:hypothetical protein
MTTKTVIALHATGRRARAGLLSLACGLAALGAGCGTEASLASGSSPVAAEAAPHEFCAYEIAAPTGAEIAAINRYWTPLARSAVMFVSRGKMLVPVPRKHLNPAQRRALRRAEWAWRAFSPKPELVCSPAGRKTGGPIQQSRRAAGRRA